MGPTAALAPGESPDPALEDQYGEQVDGPEVEDDPRLDTEVTDEDTDSAMGLDDTKDDGATTLDMSQAEGDEGPDADQGRTTRSTRTTDETTSDDASTTRTPSRPPTRSRSSAESCGPSRVTGSWCTPTPAWRTG